MKHLEHVKAPDIPRKNIVLWVCGQCGMKLFPDAARARGRCQCGNVDGALVQFEPGEQDA